MTLVTTDMEYAAVNASSVSVHVALPDISYTLVWWKQDRSFLVIKSLFKFVKDTMGEEQNEALTKSMAFNSNSLQMKHQLPEASRIDNYPAQGKQDYASSSSDPQGHFLLVLNYSGSQQLWILMVPSHCVDPFTIGSS